MSKHSPTQVGDALILQTKKTFTTYAVGSVSKQGQQDFQGEVKVHHVTNQADAVKAAKSLVAPNGRIYLLNIDAADWSEISN